MVRIFLSAGHGAGDPGAEVPGTTEAEEMIKTRDAAVKELRSRGLDVLWVPDTLTLKETIYWINDHCRRGDVALEIHADSLENTNVRGASIYYIDGNEQRQDDAALVLQGVLNAVPGLPSRGVKPDTATGVGRLGFCRQIDVPSILLELGFLTNPQDRALIQNRRQDFASGIADGLQLWSQTEAARQGLAPPPVSYPNIDVVINGQLYKNRGILVAGNACVPVDLVTLLPLDLTGAKNIRKLNYRNVGYIKAVDLQPLKVSIKWDNTNRAVVLSTNSEKVRS